jgi:hypothetical protein
LQDLQLKREKESDLPSLNVEKSKKYRLTGGQPCPDNIFGIRWPSSPGSTSKDETFYQIPICDGYLELNEPTSEGRVPEVDRDTSEIRQNHGNEEREKRVLSESAPPYSPRQNSTSSNLVKRVDAWFTPRLTMPKTRKTEKATSDKTIGTIHLSVPSNSAWLFRSGFRIQGKSGLGQSFGARWSGLRQSKLKPKESRTNLSSSSREASVASSFVTEETTLTSMTDATSSKYGHEQIMGIDLTPVSAPQPFQCTFCFTQCEDGNQWKGHEQSSHIEREGIICGSCHSVSRQHHSAVSSSRDIPGRNQHGFGENPRSSQRRSFAGLSRVTKGGPGSQCGTLPSHEQGLAPPTHDAEWRRVQDDWIWACGFCDILLCSWIERQEHIASGHFENGATLASWDPLRSPYPFLRSSLTRDPRFPAWNPTPLLAIQRANIQNYIDL